MKKVQRAFDEDATITEEIDIKMEKVMKDRRKRKIADYLIPAGFYANDGLNVGQGLGETPNKEVMKGVAHTSGHVCHGNHLSVLISFFILINIAYNSSGDEECSAHDNHVQQSFKHRVGLHPETNNK